MSYISQQWGLWYVFHYVNNAAPQRIEPGGEFAPHLFY